MAAQRQRVALGRGLCDWVDGVERQRLQVSPDDAALGFCLYWGLRCHRVEPPRLQPPSSPPFFVLGVGVVN